MRYGGFFLPVVRDNTDILLVTLLLLPLVFGLFTSSAYALMSERLPAQVRATGLALAYNLPFAVIGGSTSLIATWLVHSTATSVHRAVFCLLDWCRPRDFSA